MRRVFSVLMALAVVFSFTAMTAMAGPDCATKHAEAKGKAHECVTKDGVKCADVTMSIEGMTCGGCEKSIEAALLKMDGVLKVNKIDHKAGMAEVCIDPAKIKTDALVKTVVDKGYTAEIIPAVAKTTAAGGDKAHAECVKKCGKAKAAQCAATKTKGTTKTDTKTDTKTEGTDGK